MSVRLVCCTASFDALGSFHTCGTTVFKIEVLARCCLLIADNVLHIVINYQVMQASGYNTHDLTFVV